MCHFSGGCTFNLRVVVGGGGGGKKNNHFPQREEGLISFLKTQIMQHWLLRTVNQGKQGRPLMVLG